MAERVNGILLDTSVVVAHLRGRIDLQSLAAADEPLFLPLVALGELYRGVLKSARPEFNRANVAMPTKPVAKKPIPGKPQAVKPAQKNVVQKKPAFEGNSRPREISCQMSGTRHPCIAEILA